MLESTHRQQSEVLPALGLLETTLLGVSSVLALWVVFTHLLALKPHLVVPRVFSEWTFAWNSSKASKTTRLNIMQICLHFAFFSCDIVEVCLKCAVLHITGSHVFLKPQDDGCSENLQGPFQVTLKWGDYYFTLMMIGVLVDVATAAAAVVVEIEQLIWQVWYRCTFAHL